MPSDGEVAGTPTPRKDKVASVDDQKRSEADIQKITDRFIAEIDKLIASKEAEILAV